MGGGHSRLACSVTPTDSNDTITRVPVGTSKNGVGPGADLQLYT